MTLRTEVKLKNADQLLLQVQKMPEAVKAEISKELYASGMLVVNEAKALILRGMKTGRVYGKHQASAPGEAPASDTGRLVNSILHRAMIDKMGVEVVARTNYAEYLEYGTRKMAARPFFKPAAEKHIDEIGRRVAAAATKGVSRSKIK